MSCNYKSVERPGLYVMVFFLLLNSCSTPGLRRLKQIDADLTAIRTELGIPRE